MRDKHLTLVLILLGAWVGFLAYPTLCGEQETEVRWNTVYQKPEVVRTTEYVTVYVPQVVTETVTVDRYLAPRTFTSNSEFHSWVAKYFRLIVDGDCDDRALVMQQVALRDNYLVNVQKITGLYYIPGTTRLLVPGNQAHMLVSATIGNELWYYEPSTGETWKDCNLD